MKKLLLSAAVTLISVGAFADCHTYFSSVGAADWSVLHMTANFRDMHACMMHGHCMQASCGCCDMDSMHFGMKNRGDCKDMEAMGKMDNMKMDKKGK